MDENEADQDEEGERSEGNNYKCCALGENDQDCGLGDNG